MSTQITSPADLDRLDFEKGGGLVTVVAQDADTGTVLMVAHADREALVRSLGSGEMHYRSRVRGAWRKGATSGNVQDVVSLHHDCDGDAVLALVRPRGPACHLDTESCFGDAPAARAVLAGLDRVIAERAAEPAPAPSYTQRLLGDRNLRLKKIGEESAELVTALADGDAGRAVAEAADVVYHVLVALHAQRLAARDLLRELAGRQRAHPPRG